MKSVKPKNMLKSSYVFAIRLLTPMAKKIGIFSVLEARLDRRWAHWLRSLAAIHDIDDMINLDTPWWTYDAIDKVDAFLAARPNARVLEYGSGASTVWLGRRSGSVKSIEHDPTWFSLVQERTRAFSNIEIILKEPKLAPSKEGYTSTKDGFEGLCFREYACEVESASNFYDLIIIDGRARNDCLKVAKSHLSKGGLILFDNTLRRQYRDAIATSGGMVRRFPGRVPSLPYRDETTLISFPVLNT